MRSAQVLRHLGVEIADARFMWQMECADVLVYVPRNLLFQYSLIYFLLYFLHADKTHFNITDAIPIKTTPPLRFTTQIT